MVQKFFSLISIKLGDLRKAAFWLAVFAFISQLLALGRDRLLAHNFGAGIELDIYYAAFKIPDLLFVTVASLVSISALVPLFAKKQSEGERHLKEATDSIFTVFFVMIIVSCILLFFLMPYIVPVFFKSLGDKSVSHIIILSRILLLSPFLLGLSNFFGSIVQYQNRFILYSLSPILYNLGIIFGIVFGLENFGIKAVVFGVVLGALLHLLLQASFVFYSDLGPKFTSRIKWSDVYEIAVISIPRTLALSVFSFVGFVFVVFASKFGEGAIAVFNFAFNLQSAPFSLIAVSLSLAAFPSLSISAAKKERSEIIKKISDGLRLIIFWSLPISGLFIVLRAHIVRVILGSGVFDWTSTRLTAAVFAVFVMSIVFQGIQLFLSRSHYALGKTKLPLIGNLSSGVISIFTAFIFIKYFQHFNSLIIFVSNWLKIVDLRINIIILPIAFSFGAIVSCIILFFGLGKDLYREIFNNIIDSVYHSLATLMVVVLSTYITLNLTDDFFELNTFFGVFAHGAFSGIVGIILGAVILDLLNNREYKSMIGKEQGC